MVGPKFLLSLEKITTKPNVPLRVEDRTEMIQVNNLKSKAQFT